MQDTSLTAYIPWKRIILCVAAVIAPFYTPWIVAVIFSAFVALYVPPIAIIVGLLFDFLYYTGGVPYFTIAGLVVAGIAFFVHRFVKERIIS